MSEVATPGAAPGTDQPGGDQTPQTYSKDFVDKLLTEKRNWAEKAKAQEMQLKQLQETKLLEEKKFEELAAQREKEANEWREKYVSTQTKITEGIKVSEIKKELMKVGIDPKYVDETVRLADLSKVTYDSETGVVTGAESIAKVMLEKFPPLFGKTGTPNHSAPDTMHKDLNIDTFRKMKPEDKKKNIDALYAAHGITRKA